MHLELTLMLLASNVAAAGEPFSLRYSAPEGCPDRESFVDEVRARTGAHDSGSGAPYQFVVELKEEGDAVAGRLEVVDADGARTVRAIDGSTCGEVASGLALIAALIVEPGALVGPLGAAGEGGAAGVTDPTASASRVTAADRAAIEGAEAGRGSGDGAAMGTTSSRRLRWYAGAWAGAMGAVGPGSSLVVGAFGEVDVGAALVWSARASFFYAWSGDLAVGSDEAARLRLLGGRLDACAAWPLVQETVSGGPCATFDAGQLRGDGVARGRIQLIEAHPAPWLSAGGTLRIRVQPPSWRLFLEGEGAVFAPLWREEFYYVDPNITVHRVPDVGGRANVVLGAQFP
jgi:hypothetical protein